MDQINLKTVTKKELIELYDLRMENEQKLKEEGRKVLMWSESSSSEKKEKKGNKQGKGFYGADEEMKESGVKRDNAINIIDNKYGG